MAKPHPETGCLFGVPRLPERLLHRPRLDTLFDHAREAPITIVRGPGGIGKTTQVLIWCSSPALKTEPCVWVDLAFGPPTRNGCWRAVVALLLASGICRPRAGMELPPLPPGPVTVDDAIRTLKLVGSPCTLVLDDFQNIQDTAIVNDVVQLVEACPQLHLKILTRRPSPLEDPTAFRAVTPVTIPPEELFLTAPEATELAEQIAPMVPVGTRNALVSLADGSALLLRMLLLSPSHALKLREFAQVATGGELPPLSDLTELLSEHFGDVSGAELALTHLAVPVLLTRELAADLVGGTLAERLLNVLENGALGWWSQVRGQWFFHLHSVISTVLRAWFRREPQQTQVALHRRLSVWMSKHGFVDAAVEHASLAKDSKLIVDAVLASIGKVIFDLRPEIITPVSKLPTSVLVREPLLCIMVGLSYNANSDTAQLGQKFFRMAIMADQQHSRRSTMPLRLFNDAVFTGVYRLVGMLDRSAERAERGWELTEHLPVPVRVQQGHLIQAIAQQGGITHLLHGTLTEAAAWFRRAVSTALELPCFPGALATSYGLQALVSMELGELPEMRQVLKQVSQSPQFEGWSESFRSCPDALARARDALSHLDVSGAQHELSRVTPHLDTVEFWPFALSILTEVYLLENKPLKAATALNRAEELAKDRPQIAPLLRSRLLLCRVLINLALGNPLHETQIVARDAWTSLAKAMLLSRSGQHSKVVQLTNRWLHREETPLGLVHALLLLHSESLRNMGKPAAAVKSLDRAFSLTTELDDLLPLTLFGGDSGAGLMSIWREVHPGELPPIDLCELPQFLPERMSSFLLTKSERQVLQGLSTGLTSREIASSRKVSMNTVKSQIRSLYRKLHAGSRAEALAAAAEAGLLRDAD